MKRALATLMLLSSGLALADTAAALQPNQHLGWYLGGTAGTNLYYVGLAASGGSFSSEGLNGFSWSGETGYHFTTTTALEAGAMQNYAYYNSTDYDFFGNPTTEKIYGNTNLYYLAARFDVPIKDRFSFIGKLGLMYASGSLLSDDDTDSPQTAAVILPFTGLGFGYAFTPHLSMDVMYQGAVYTVVSAGGLGAGLDYYFN